MPGSKGGGIKAAHKNKENDPDFYKKIGSLGGKKSNNREWANTPEGHAKLSAAGTIGGRISRSYKSNRQMVSTQQCRCGHPLNEHIGDDMWCSISNCFCDSFWNDPAPRGIIESDQPRKAEVNDAI